jgi:hypothetical protein
MAKMGSEDDPSVRAARDLLQDRLEHVFEKTSADCYDRLANLQELYPDIGATGYESIRAGIKRWRENSLECISEGFRSFVALLRESHQDEGETPVELAEMLSWQAIDRAFLWTTKKKSNRTRFKEWITRATAADALWVEGLRMVSPKCNRGKGQTTQLNCDFRSQFERLLYQLRKEAFLGKPTAQSTSTATFSEPPAPEVQNVFVHGHDYRAVIVKGKKYNLTPNQALVFETLYDAYVKRLPAVSKATLLKSMNAPHSRLRDSFRSGDGPKLWKNLIRRVRRGMYALRLPPQ